MMIRFNLESLKRNLAAYQVGRFFLIDLMFISCNHLSDGVVIKKEYQPARTYVSFIPVLSGKTTILIPYIIYDDEDYVLEVRGDYKGENKIETVYVSKSCYENLKSGDHWVKDSQCSYSDDNNTKKRQ